MIPMLTRLDQELAQCADPIRQAELQAERASYLARTGHFVEANEILSALRKSYGDGRSARVSVWIMFVEGLVLYFERVSADARDRLLRAHAISSAAGLPDLRLLTAAWLAHFEFERGSFEEMGRLIALVSASPDNSSPDVRARVAIVLADAFSYSGDPVKAQMWFEICRQNALEAGDRATVGALMYNRSAFGLWRARVEHFGHGDLVDLERLSLLEIELSSSWAFQVGTNVVSLSHLIELSRARFLIFRNRFSEAIEILAPLQSRMSSLENRNNRSSVVADLGWCFLNSGNAEAARNILRDVDLADIRKLDVDDRLVTFSILTRIADSLGVVSRRMEYESELLDAHLAYNEEMARLKAVLDSDSFSLFPRSQ